MSPLRFTVQRGGDPYSRTAEVTAHMPTGDVFRGDLSGRAGTRATERVIRSLYPGVPITRA